MYDESVRKCNLLIRPETNVNSTFWLMGDSFLRAYYSIYDMENARIGLVGKANNTNRRLTFLNGGTFSDTL